MRQPVVILPFALSILLAACNPCPRVTKVDATSASPALVQVLFSVQCGEEPVATLGSSDITLFEGGAEVSQAESQWSLRRQSAVLENYTLLLIDVSDSIIGSGTLEIAREVASSFAATLVDQNQDVSVAVFDGDPEVRTIVAFTADIDALTEAIEGIDIGDQLDESTNLNGAIVQSLELLDGQVEPDVAGELMSVANLVVFTDGRDSANRTADAVARSAVGRTDHQVFVVGLVDEESEESEESVAELEALAPDGFFRATDPDALFESFGALADRLLDEVNKYYRLSYCSPLRRPRTTLRAEITWEEKTASVQFGYPTKDFGPGCALPSGD
ncbi:MAG: vWA domain-containing protein [Myxococcota bacterium]|nr:vWA domain-containing protein [Myxococcota bacterium]